jgi:16S rRNA (adenine1518-N6/adenine1519-N6)-dimethyltransferase
VTRSGPAAGSERPLTAPSRIQALLRRHGLTPDKGFGQNFLVDASALRAIVDAAEVSPADTVFEAGPGLGVLTRALAERAERVVSVELDRRLMPVLAETLAGIDNVELVEGDAVRFDYASLPEGALLVANLPYNAATAVLTRALESARFRRLVFLVQREVADRLTAEPGTPAYGTLSLLVRHFGSARQVRRVPPGAFLPPPKVTSSVVRVDVRAGTRADPTLFAFIRSCFAHRRKTLLKNLTMAGHDRARVGQALARLDLDERIRAEALGLEAFRELLRDVQRREDPS